jgi:hypothetical protein
MLWRFRIAGSAFLIEGSACPGGREALGLMAGQALAGGFGPPTGLR